MKIRTFLLFAFVLLLLGLAPSVVQAQTSTSPTLTKEASRTDALTASQGQNKVIDKITGDFSSFYGADTRNIVVGLRNGTPIQLTTTGGTPVTITPAGKMGFGNVFITMALAKQQLSGFTQPTTTQVQGAFQDILNLRASGMGWGQIAHHYNLNLGEVLHGLKASNNAMAATTSTSSTGSGVVTSSGKSVGKGVSGKGETGEGIVSGSGRPTSAGSESGITTGGGHAYGNSGGGPGGGGQGGKGQAK